MGLVQCMLGCVNDGTAGACCHSHKHGWLSVVWAIAVIIFILIPNNAVLFGARSLAISYEYHEILLQYFIEKSNIIMPLYIQRSS